MEELNNKQIAFCHEYIKDLNGARAYKEIYSPKTENSAVAGASRLLSKVNVQAYISSLTSSAKEEARKRAIADATEVMEYLSAMMRGEIKEEQVVVVGDEFGTRAEIVKKQAGAKDRNKCAELLGKRYKLFTEKQEIDVQAQVIFEGEDELED